MVARESWGVDAGTLIAKIESGFTEWLSTTGAARADATIETLGRVGQSYYVLTLSDGTTKNVTTPRFFVGTPVFLRDAMADRLRGAWTWAHLWMEAQELVLHAAYEWLR